MRKIELQTSLEVGTLSRNSCGIQQRLLKLYMVDSGEAHENTSKLAIDTRLTSNICICQKSKRFERH